ncbi:MAG: hypothetical protein BWY17_03338 [Deltaproteobacteria bacterium ADurb.Bin207]|nr:MAG: hypothetical protein BWY17_03338 [Deltaproteobacteria bacterium ADurb.Bin207]
MALRSLLMVGCAYFMPRCVNTKILRNEMGQERFFKWSCSAHETGDPIR